MNAQDDGLIDFRELFDIFWRGRWIIILSAMSACIMAGFVAASLPKKYQATIVVSAVSANSANGRMGGLGSLASQFGGLASIAGITLGNDTEKSESIAVLQSGLLTERYISENNLLPVIFHKAWDSEKKQWKTDDLKKMPTLWKANQYFKKKIRAVAEDKKTGLLSVTIVWTDPQVAARWANDLVKVTNDYLRNKAIEQSERHIAYLTEQAAKTEMVQVRSAIYAVMESELKNAMLARGDEEFALKIIDPAVPSERPFSPNMLLWVVAGIVFGALASSLFLIARRAFTKMQRA